MTGRRSRLVAVAVALLLVTAGCTTNVSETATPADVPSPSVETTPSEDGVADNESDSAGEPSRPEISVRPHYDVNASLVFERVMDRLGEEGMTEPNVTVSGERIDELESQVDTSQSPLLSAFGLGNDSDGEFRFSGVATGGYDVVMRPNLSDAGAEKTLAHEFVHVAQSQRGFVGEWNPTNVQRSAADGYSGIGFDDDLARTLRTEGSATYAGQMYRLEYLPNETDYDSLDAYRSAFESSYLNQTGERQYGLAPYYYGLEYFADRVGETDAVRDLGMYFGDTRPPSDEPWSVKDVFRYSGGTTERLLHPDADNESLRIPNLSVTDENTSATLTNRGTAGELFTRIALDQELPRDRAIEAAAGWGTDKLYRVDTGGWLWVSRWDSAGDADEFASAMSDFGEARPGTVTVGERDPDTVTGGVEAYQTEFAVEQPTEDTVVTYVGPESLPETLSVTVDGGTVTVADG